MPSIFVNQNVAASYVPQKDETPWMYSSPGAALCYEFKTFFPMDESNEKIFREDFAKQCLIEEDYLKFLHKDMELPDFMPNPDTNYLKKTPTVGLLGCQTKNYAADSFFSTEWNGHLQRGQDMAVYGLLDSSTASSISPTGENHYFIYLWILDKCIKYNPLLDRYTGQTTTPKSKGVWNKCFAGWKDGKNPDTGEYTKELPYGACAWAAYKCKSEKLCTEAAEDKVKLAGHVLPKLAGVFLGEL